MLKNGIKRGQPIFPGDKEFLEELIKKILLKPQKAMEMIFSCE